MSVRSTEHEAVAGAARCSLFTSGGGDSHGLEQYLHSGEFSDVVLKCGDHRYQAHRLVLAQNSDYFARLFAPGFREQTEREIHLLHPDPHNEFPSLLSFLYTGRVQVTADNVLALLILADHYLVEPLKRLCTDFLTTRITRHNALPLLKQAIENNAEEIERRCLLVIARTFARKRLRTVDWSFLPLDVFCRLLAHKYLAVYDEYTLYIDICRYISAYTERLVLQRRPDTSQSGSESTVETDDTSEGTPLVLRRKSCSKEWDVRKQAASELPRVAKRDSKKKGYQRKGKHPGSKRTKKRRATTVDAWRTLARNFGLSKEDVMWKLFSNVRFRWFSYEQMEEAVANELVPRELLIDGMMANLRPCPHSTPSSELLSDSSETGSTGGKSCSDVIRRPVSPRVWMSAHTTGDTPMGTSVTGHTRSLSVEKGGKELPGKKFNRELRGEERYGRSLENDPEREKGMEAKKDLSPRYSSPSGASKACVACAELYASKTWLQPRMTFGRQFPLKKYASGRYSKGILAYLSRSAAGSSSPHIRVTASSTEKGTPAALVDISNPSELWTKDVPASWFQLDLGHSRAVVPVQYLLRHGGNYKADCIRTWDFQGSVDGSNWELLRRHTSDESLNDPFAVATWVIDCRERAYRFFRVLQTGHNSNGHNFLALSGLEIYGDLYEGDIFAINKHLADETGECVAPVL